MIRKHFYITKRQVKQLQALAKKTGLSGAELIRRAIDQYLEGKK